MDIKKSYETELSPAEEVGFREWKKTNAPNDSGADYDLRGAYKKGLSRSSDSGHFSDEFKKPTHPTFSNESIYAKDKPEWAGSWRGENFVPHGLDLESAFPVKQNEFGATIKAEPIDMSTAKPMKSLQGMVGSHPEAEFRQRKDPTTGLPDQRYVRPQTDIEKDQSTADLVGKQLGKETNLGVKVSRALETPEARAVETGALTFGFSPMLDAIRGVTSAAVPESDVFNMIIDSAKKGILEPGTVEPTSVAVMSAYPKMDWVTAGVLGTVAEIGFTTNLLEDVGKVGMDALSRDTQFTKTMNRMKSTEEWNRGVQSISEKIGVPVDEVANQISRKLWETRNDADYWSMLRGNIGNSFGLRGLSVDPVGDFELGPLAKGLPAPADRGEKIVGAAVKLASGEIVHGPTHEDALNKKGLTKDLEKKDNLMRDAEGSPISVNLPPGHPSNFATAEEYVASRKPEIGVSTGKLIERGNALQKEINKKYDDIAKQASLELGYDKNANKMSFMNDDKVSQRTEELIKTDKTYQDLIEKQKNAKEFNQKYFKQNEDYNKWLQSKSQLTAEWEKAKTGTPNAKDLVDHLSDQVKAAVSGGMDQAEARNLANGSPAGALLFDHLSKQGMSIDDIEKLAKSHDVEYTPNKEAKSGTIIESQQEQGTGAPTLGGSQEAQGPGTKEINPAASQYQIKKSELGFYSKAEQIINDKIPNATTKEQLINTLKNNGVKDDEIEQLGLDALEGKISKADLQTLVQAHQVPLEEKVLGQEQRVLTDDEFKRLDELTARNAKKPLGAIEDDEAGSWNELLTLENVRDKSTMQQLLDKSKEYEMMARGEQAKSNKKQADKYWERSNHYTARSEELGLSEEGKGGLVDKTKFGQYQLPGGENYREVLIKLPTSEPVTTMNQIKEVVETKDGEWVVKMQDGRKFVYPDAATSVEARNNFERDLQRGRIDVGTIDSKNVFRSSHFDDANILVHARINDRVVDGKKVLFIEEIQSDWHQKGRKEGYGDRKLSDKDKALFEKLSTIPPEKRTMEQSSALDYMMHLKEQKGVPDAPFKKTWHELMFKRLLDKAVKEGYDSVAWTTGEQQAARYDLSKQIDEIRYVKNENGTFDVSVYRDGNNLTYDLKIPSNLKAAEIEEYVGKDVAKRIVNDEGIADESLGDEKALTGEQLKVGGEGMKGFYDQMLPSFVNKYTKKWGGRVREVEMPLTDNPKALKISKGGQALDTTAKVHSLEITPAMKDAILKEGQPLFSMRKEGAGEPIKETPQQAVKRVKGLMRDLGVKLNKLEFIDEERVVDVADPAMIEALGQAGYTKEEIDNAIAKGEKFVIVGEHEITGAEESEVRSNIRFFRGHTAKDVYHEAAHAIAEQGGLPGWKGSKEEIARYLEDYLASGKRSISELTAAGGKIVPRKKGISQTWHGDIMSRGRFNPESLAAQGHDPKMLRENGHGHLIAAPGKGMQVDEYAQEKVNSGMIQTKGGDLPVDALMKIVEEGKGKLLPGASRANEGWAKLNKEAKDVVTKELERLGLEDKYIVIEGQIESVGVDELNDTLKECGEEEITNEDVIGDSTEEPPLQLVKEGEDFEAHMVDDKGNLYTRDQSEALYGVGESEHIDEQGTDAAEQRKAAKKKDIQNEQNKAKKLFVRARIAQLEGEAEKLQAELYEAEEDRSNRGIDGRPVQRAVEKIDSLNKKIEQLDEEIQRLYMGDAELSELRNKVYETKAKDLLDEQDAIEKEALKIGHGVGKLEERERQLANLEHEINELKNKVETTLEGQKRKAELLRLKEDILLRSRLKAKQLKTEKEKKELAMKEAYRTAVKQTARAIRKMADQIKNLSTKSLPIEYQDKIEAIKSNFDFNKRTGHALAERMAMQDFVARQLEQGNEINIPTEKLDLIHRLPLNDMTFNELKDVHEAIMRLYHNGRLKNKLLTAQKERTFDELVQKAVDSISGGEGITPETTIIKALKAQDKSWADKSWDALHWYILNNMRPELMYMSMDGWTPGIMTNTAWDVLYRAENGEILDSDLFHTVIGKTHEMLPIKDLHVKANVGRFKNMTKSNAMFIYANSFNEGNRLHLEGSGITDEDIAAVESFLSPAEKKSVADMIKFFDNYMYPRLSKVYERIEGVHLPKEDNYFPIDRLEDVSYDKELERDLLERSYIKRPGVSKGFTKARVSSTKGFSEFDYFGTIYRHMDKVAHYLNFAEPVRDVNKLLLSPEIRASITKKFGKDYYDIIYKHLKDVAAGKLHSDREILSDVLDFVRTRATPLYLGYNLLTTLKQFVGFLQGMELAGKASTLKALMELAKHPKVNLNFVDGKSPMMKFRSMRQEREFQEIVANRSWEDKLGEVTGLQWLREKSLVPTLFVDRLISNCVWRGAYGEAKLKGLSEQVAVESADRTVRLSQPMGGLIHLPHMFRGGKAQRMMTFLKGHTNKLWNLQLMMIGMRKEGKTSNSRFASQLLFYTLLPAVAMFTIERKRLPKTIQEMAGAIGRQATVSLWGIEDMFRAIESGRFVGVSTPLEDYLNKLGKLLTDKKMQTRIDDALYLAAGMVGFPYVGVRRALKGQPFGAPEKEPAGSKKERKSWQDTPQGQSRREKVRKVWDQ